VGTDNWPVDFRYISKRLVRDIVEQHQAARPRRVLSGGLNIKGASFTARAAEPDYKNRFDLARRATEAISDNTGTLEIGGDYVRAELELVPAHFKVHLGWRRSYNQEVAAFFADGTYGSFGRTFVGLFGSISNFTGRIPVEAGSGWWPSDVVGLYHILEAAREQTDARPIADYVKRDVSSDGSSSYAVARVIAHHIAERFTAERLEFLAKAFYQVHDVEMEGAAYDTVLIGAPIWVATPQPTALDDPGVRREEEPE
jgi:hypothetical protein